MSNKLKICTHGDCVMWTWNPSGLCDEHVKTVRCVGGEPLRQAIVDLKDGYCPHCGKMMDEKK